MAAIETACRGVVEKVDGAVACGVVDLRSGLLLGAFEPQPTDALSELVAAAVLDLLRGPTIPAIESRLMPTSNAAAGGERGFHELHLTSTDHFHFTKMFKAGNCAIVLITKKSANVGMGWAHLKAIIPTLEPLTP